MSGYFYRRDGSMHDDPVEFGRLMFDVAARQVALTTTGDVTVSTVFTGIDYRFGRGVPLLYETMISGGPLDDYCERYSNEVAALAGHDRACASARDRALTP